MKLTTAWIDQTQNQLDMRAVPMDHPAAGKLNEMFGEHTFFLGADGLHIVEETESDRDDADVGEVVKLAEWGDEERTTLKVKEPELVGVVVVVEKGRNGHA